jgi:IS4 transposase
MRHQNTICHALLKAIPRHRFERLVEAHRGTYRDRDLSFWSQFVALVHAQLSGAQTLRHLIAALESHGNLLYHLGMGDVRRSTLSDANRDRPAALFKAVFDFLLPKLRGGLASEACEALRLIDATVLPLNGTLCRWAHVGTKSTGAKLHLVYDPKAACPTYFAITPARVNDITAAQTMPIEPGATYVFDKGYCDFGWWAALDAAGCRFVTRLKKSSPAHLVDERPVCEPAIISDRLITLNARQARNRCNPLQGTLREIIVLTEDRRTLRLVTNDLTAPASDIAALYKARWQIELFFKWVKQNLRIKKFLGTSENAVKIQIIVALIAFLLVRLAHQPYAAITMLTAITRKVRANLMHRKSIAEMLLPPLDPPDKTPQMCLSLPYA